MECTVSGHFDDIEDLIEGENTFTMEEFADSINKFLTFREYRILSGRGRISMKAASEKTAKEYDVFNKTQKITSDFGRFISIEDALWISTERPFLCLEKSFYPP